MFKNWSKTLTYTIAILLVATAAESATINVVCLGDSLTEGYGIEKDKAYPILVEKKFADQNQSVHVINAGISGSTTASGLDRLKWYLKGDLPQALFLELGANDGLRGQSIDGMKKNLRDVIDLAKAHKIQVLLAGMKLPQNYGKEYSTAFHKAFVDLAKEEKIPLLPFLLEGVALHPDLVQPDGLHPNEEGHKVVAETVFKFFTEYLNGLKQTAKSHAN